MEQRELKFRAWSIGMGMMVYSEKANGNNLGQFFDHGIAADWPIMQFIGQKDRNGQAIYEGDVVKYNHSTAEHNLPLKYFGEVKWRDDCSKFVISCEEFQDIIWSEIEVAGNIHEHPHLLSGGN